MYRRTHQKEIFPIFYSGGLDSLKQWHIKHRDGWIKRIYDHDTGILVMEMYALNVSLTYISTPRDLKQTLGIRLPILNFLLRNMNKYFSFEVKILDDTRMRRRFRCGNFITKSTINLTETTIPLTMAGSDWVLIYFNLAEFTRRCYDCSYLETDRVQVNGSIQLRHIFFSEKVIEYSQLPKNYQISIIEKKEPIRKPPPKARPPSPLSMKGRSSRSKILDKADSASNISSTGRKSPSEIPGSPKIIASATSLGNRAEREITNDVEPTRVPSQENTEGVIETTADMTAAEETPTQQPQKAEGTEEAKGSEEIAGNQDVP